ncbi:Peptidyl-prolyl cis-trans isomerase ppiD [Rubrivivax sp. A210]|uniref:SurA N-terminal domain-containing protein n=1 Tax=Rubrivivax sp. A210 TaxID=2772301 RepID=UPI001919CD27|nr:SurA N-terminal domain-containing protein [Rubrivivax sp. A210]CAD5372882.1 Peptidyl-prolyl cis-trans isomerase ppiD [Rubrivivax sp. A210]
MFDFVRDHTRWVLGFMLLLIIPSFVFFGVQGYTRFTGAENATVAKVDGRTITRAEWDSAHDRTVDRARRQQPGLDTAVLNTPQARRDTLEGLVRDRVLLAAAQAMHLTPSDARLQRLFVTDPQFAGMRNPDGSVNRELLAAQGMNSEMFAAQLRQEFAVQQVVSGVLRTSFATPGVALAGLDPLLQKRELQWQRFDPAAYRARVNPSDADLEAYYKKNEARFKAAESAQIEYVMLDLDTIAKGLKLSDADLKKFYDDNAARFTAPPERRASHILIKADKAAPEAERKKARERAEALLAEARKTPAAFADLARKNSQDTASATQGGDLDFFGRGAMVKAFEDAAFALEPGKISDIVETDFGYHVIMVTAARGGNARPFAEARGEIELELLKTTAQRRWPELAEQFTNTVYEQSDSLQPVIDKLKLEKRTATVRRTAQPGEAGPLASPKLLDAIFAKDTITNKRNTDAVETGTNRLVSARVLQHTPARTLALAEVKEAVRERVAGEQAAALARTEGQARLAEAQKDAALALPTAAVVSRLQAPGVPRAVVEAAMRADAAKLPVAAGVDLGPEGYAVLRVTKVLPLDDAQANDAGLRGQYTQAWAMAEGDAYLKALKKRFKAEIKAEADAPAESASAPVR